MGPQDQKDSEMKAMVLKDSGPVETAPLKLESLPRPTPAAKEVLIRVKCCGICRTDLHIIEGELPEQKRPVVPGHQIVGTVERLGSHCKRLAVGDLVGIAWLRFTCGKCSFCLSGKENLCESSRFTGYHVDGGYAEYAVVPEAFAYELPAGFEPQSAAPLLCAGIIGYRALKRSQLRRGGSVALYGFGSSAHVVIQIAKGWGCEVYVVSRGKGHQQLATEMGADWVGEDPGEMPQKVESAIIFAPVGTLVPPALASLQKGGTLALAGIYMSDIPPLGYEKHLFYERNVSSVTANTREDGKELLVEAVRLGVRPRTHAYPLTDANRALLDLKLDKIKGSGVLII